MRSICLAFSLALGSLAVLSCGGGDSSIAASDYNPGYGPFDKNGNYVEAWADKPAKKHWWARKGTTTPASSAKPKSTAIASNTKPKSTALASNTTSSRAPGSVSTVSRSSSSYRRPTTTVVSDPAPRPAYTPKPTYTPKAKPKPAYTPPKPKPKPTPKPVKPKKPAPIRHLVKKGDTLYGLSRKYGTTVSAIQRANRMSGTTIVTGKTLLIPR